jgi:hypothetical protein
MRSAASYRPCRTAALSSPHQLARRTADIELAGVRDTHDELGFVALEPGFVEHTASDNRVHRAAQADFAALFRGDLPDDAHRRRCDLTDRVRAALTKPCRAPSSGSSVAPSWVRLTKPYEIEPPRNHAWLVSAQLVEQLGLRPLRALALTTRQLVDDVGHAVALRDRHLLRLLVLRAFSRLRMSVNAE